MIIPKSENEELKRTGSGRRCPDYDKDCVNIKNHVKCFIGGETRCVTDQGKSILVNVDIAGGYCPFIHLDN